MSRDPVFASCVASAQACMADRTSEVCTVDFVAFGSLEKNVIQLESKILKGMKKSMRGSHRNAREKDRDTERLSQRERERVRERERESERGRVRERQKQREAN